VTRAWLLCLLAPLVWFVHFSALYGIASFAGALGSAAWILTSVALVAIAVAWRLARRLPPSDVRAIARWLTLLSLAGVVFQILVLTIVPR
jgi:drug/metabolite transporter (DMT)-like permease